MAAMRKRLFTKVSSTRHLYLQVLETMDQQLGSLFDLVRNDKTLRENTIIVAYSDNGPGVGYGSAGHLRGHMATQFDGENLKDMILGASVDRKVKGLPRGCF
jgi:arylsulfatase A-like enzyme